MLITKIFMFSYILAIRNITLPIEFFIRINKCLPFLNKIQIALFVNITFENPNRSCFIAFICGVFGGAHSVGAVSIRNVRSMSERTFVHLIEKLCVDDARIFTKLRNVRRLFCTENLKVIYIIK